MSTVVTNQTVSEVAPGAVAPRAVYVYSHSYLYYWWPVWAVGFVMALLTYIQGERVHFTVGDVERSVLIHPSHNMGVIFTFTFLLVILMTHITVRGIASVAVIIGMIALVL